MDGEILGMKIENFDNIPIYISKEKHLRNAFEKAKVEGYIIEFGVYVGSTIKRIANFTSQEIFGFDSFEGLPEAWKWNRGHIKNEGFFKLNSLPIVPKHVILIKGWFKDTIPEWKKTHKDSIKFLHIDSDLYSSAKTILEELNAQIIPDTIIVFDELIRGQSGYEYWEEGEWKALHEWCNNFNREYVPLAKTRKSQVTIKIIK